MDILFANLCLYVFVLNTLSNTIMVGLVLSTLEFLVVCCCFE